MFPGFARVVLFYEQGGSPLAAALGGLSPGDGVLLITGPEGGFSAMEAEEAKKRGAFITTLGPRILRAETAAVMAVALSLYEVGELGGKT
jgi:16S rRNA (uracil1498-N3)-methyltransferase